MMDRKTAAVILAAGRSENIEGIASMLTVGRTTMIQREIDTLRKAGVSPIVVVTGYMAEELEKHLSHRGALFVRNERYAESEMLDSVRIGLGALPEETEQVLLMPADMPMIGADTIVTVAEACREAAAPVCRGSMGHPLCIARALWDRILTSDSREGLRGVLAGAGIEVERIPVEDPGILIDTNSMSDYDRVLALEKERRMEQKTWFRTDIVLGRDEEAFNGLTASFLEAAGEYGSMLSACEKCGISYSKGWKMVRAAEEQFNVVFLTRQPGGAKGGSSELTPEGRRFIAAYRAFEEKVREFSGKIYPEYASALSGGGDEKRH